VLWLKCSAIVGWMTACKKTGYRLRFYVPSSSSSSGASMTGHSRLHELTPLGTFHAELRPRLCCWRSSSIVRSQVRLGRPGGHCQPTGRWLIAARRAREWSWDGPACPTQHKIGHFGDVPQDKRLVWGTYRYGKTKPNTTKAYIHQSKDMYYNTK